MKAAKARYIVGLQIKKRGVGWPADRHVAVSTWRASREREGERDIERERAHI